MDSIVFVLTGAIFGGVVGYLIALLAARAKQSAINLDISRELEGERIKTGTLEAEKSGFKNRLESKEGEFKALNEEFSKERSEHGDLRVEHSSLQSALKEKQRSFEDQLTQLEATKKELKAEFENLANRILKEKGAEFSAQHEDSLSKLLKPFKTQISEFQTRVNEVHSESIKSNASIEKEIQNVVKSSAQLSGDAVNLTSALKGDKKTTGDWGEIQLEKTLQLAGLVSGDHYDSQRSYKDSEGTQRRPDFVVHLPDEKHIVIDSKVSLVAYDSAIGADTQELADAALADHVKAVRKHIDELAAKDYSNLLGIRSPSFVLMFMPIEPAYIEAMKHNKDLFNYGYDKGVILVSHTTLMPILKTVSNLWMIERSNVEARELGDKAGDIYNQVCVVAERLAKLGNSLQATSNHYNSTVVSLIGQQGLEGKVVRFKELSSKATKNIPKIEPMHVDIETDRLEFVAKALPEDEASALVDTTDSATTRDQGHAV